MTTAIQALERIDALQHGLGESNRWHEDRGASQNRAQKEMKVRIVRTRIWHIRSYPELVCFPMGNYHPCMECSRLLYISNSHILRSALRTFALLFLAQFHGSMMSVTLNCRVLIQLDWLLL